LCLKDNFFTDINNFAHLILNRIIEEGDNVIDATVGNGKDTIFLAEKVGAKGKVYGFDIQKKALSQTKEVLRQNNLIERVEIISSGHENLDIYVQKKVKAIVFNLGYLPGADHSITTKRETTIEALTKSAKILKKNGVILLTVYTGHHGSNEERESVQRFMENLSKKEWDVLQWSYLNRDSAPLLIVGYRR